MIKHKVLIVVSKAFTAGVCTTVVDFDTKKQAEEAMKRIMDADDAEARSGRVFNHRAIYLGEG